MKNTFKNISEMSIEELQDLSKKIAYCALRQYHKKTCDNTAWDQMQAILKNDIYHSSAWDLVQTATLELLINKDDEYDFAVSQAYKSIHKEFYKWRSVKGRKDKTSESFKYTIVSYDAMGEPVEYEHTRNEISHKINNICAHGVINNITKLLTPRKKEILKLLSYGLSQEQISEKLKISHQATSKHIESIRNLANLLYPGGFYSVFYDDRY